MTKLSDLQYLKRTKLQRLWYKLTLFFFSIPGWFVKLGRSILGFFQKVGTSIKNFFVDIGTTFTKGNPAAVSTGCKKGNGSRRAQPSVRFRAVLPTIPFSIPKFGTLATTL